MKHPVWKLRLDLIDCIVSLHYILLETLSSIVFVYRHFYWVCTFQRHRDFQTWIKTRPHLPCAALGHVTVGIKQKTLKLDRTFVFLSWNILLCINIIISPAPLTLVMYLLRWSSLQYWMFNWKCHIDILKYFLEWT